MGNETGWLHLIPDRGVLIGQREKLGLTQDEVAAKAGIQLKQYQMYESHDGREFSNTSMRIVVAVLTALELDPTAFANGDYHTEPILEDDPLYKALKEIE